MKHRRTLLLLFGTTVGVLLVVLMITYRNLDRFSSEHQAIRSGHLTLRLLESLLSSIKGTETALREFRQLSDTTALEDLPKARRDLNMNVELIAALVGDDARSRMIDSLATMTSSAFAALGTMPLTDVSISSDTLRRQAIDEALAWLRASRGVHGRLVRAEEGVLKQSRDREARMGISTPLLLLVFALTTLLAISLLFIKIYQSMAKAARAEGEIQRKIDELDAEVRTREFAERSLKQVLDSSISGIMAFRSVRDNGGNITDFEWIMVNHRAEIMLGRAGHDLIGKRMLDVLPGTRESGLVGKYVEVVNSGKALHLDNAHDVNGLGLRLDINAVKLADGIVVTYTDVSDRERQQAILRESERLALTGKIARTIAHEVRNPLTNVLLALDQLKEEEGLPVTVLPMADIVRRNVDRIAHLITEMIDSSKPRDTDRAPCEIGTILKDTVELVRDRLELQHIGLVLDIAPGLPSLQMDRGEIELALSNITINSIEAMDQGTGRLSIAAAPAGRDVRVSIADNGRGIAESDLSRLFDPFYTGRPGGMGLGLTTARSILNNHGVHIDVTSRVGEGTCFTLIFPGPAPAR